MDCKTDFYASLNDYYNLSLGMKIIFFLQTMTQVRTKYIVALELTRIDLCERQLLLVFIHGQIVNGYN